ncbi:MAG TPA: DNA double-strand break repair nuclease NurA [Pyrinomonadaceae bacterium]|jgi:hypothetical protein|nr:DNA double-strand break repair nuclease NurA [Pyrinomonadaceae bacterium]
MFYQDHLARALAEQRDEFASFCAAWQDETREYANALRRSLRERTVEEINEAALQSSKGPGALLSPEFAAERVVGRPFREQWRSHEEARRWALETLRDRVTFAADGSQLLPGREISLPTAAVQIAFFENAHRDGGSYRKDARLFIVSPRELLEGYGEANWTAESVISYRRFVEEIKALADFIERQRGWCERGERVPLGFFDGTLLISYARPRTSLQDKYIEAILDLVARSREARVPIVGFIDQSYARDIVNFIGSFEAAGQKRRTTSLYDAQILSAEADGDEDDASSFGNWGDRTGFFYCLREGLTGDFLDEGGRSRIGFVYLQTMGEGAPARLDVPTWVYESNLLDEVIDTVRAECVVGNGYPYPIEAADAAAVITTRDRERFLRAMQEFAARENFSFYLSRKTTSKARRR